MSMTTKRHVTKRPKPARRVVKDSPLPSVLGIDRIREAVWSVSRGDTSKTNGAPGKIPSEKISAAGKTRKNGKLGRIESNKRAKQKA